MSEFDTGLPVPSTDPRDLQDNATVFDELLNSELPSVPDRLGVARKTWHQMEEDAEALVSPNVASLAALIGAADRGLMFTGLNTLGVFSLTALGRTFLAAATSQAQRAVIGLDSAAIMALAAQTPAANKLAYFDSTTTAALADFSAVARTLLAASTQAAQRTALGVLAQSDKPAWTTYSPTVSSTSGTYTSISATGRYLVLFGICHLQITLTITTVGTGTFPIVTLPFAALAGSGSFPIPCKAGGVTGFHGGARITGALTAVAPTRYDNGDFSANGEVVYIQGSYPIA